MKNFQEEMPGKRLRIAVLLSGSGTTLQNLLDHIRQEKLAGKIVLAVADRAGVKGLDRARDANIPAETVLRNSCASVEDFSQRIFDLCRKAQVELVCMAGFLRLLRIPPDYTNRVMNIHPALIPAFSGKGYHGPHVHKAVVESGVKVTGCTVHFADNHYDHGPIILQKIVPVLDDDSAEQVAARVFEAECQAYPEAVQLFAQGKLKVEGRRVRQLP
ncbi:MAG: phosphoribosylglycinamide formyltransferase [Gemmataceae bacterium]|nr:phosphoribosylglycinamide formyltransferase [Gemmataceae bacterium]